MDKKLIQHELDKFTPDSKVRVEATISAAGLATDTNQTSQITLETTSNSTNLRRIMIF